MRRSKRKHYYAKKTVTQRKQFGNAARSKLFSLPTLTDQQWLVRGCSLIVGGILLLVAISLWRKNDELVALQPALPQDPLIQVYFNHSQSAAYTEPYRQQYRFGYDLEQLIVEAIASAQVSVDVAVQELQLPRIAHALHEKHRQGIRVRVVLENQYSTPWSDYSAHERQQLDERAQDDYMEFQHFVDVNGDRHISHEELLERDALTILRSSGIPVIDDTADGSKGSGLMHHKFLIIDNQMVMIGSLNFTMSGTHGDVNTLTSLGNANHLINIKSTDMAAIFTQEFELLWGDGPQGHLDSKFGLQKPYRAPQTVSLGPQSSVTVQFSPTSPRKHPWDKSTNGLIGQTLNTSQHTIDLALFVFSAQPLSHILQQQQQQGVRIRALIDEGFIYRAYSEALDMMGVALPNDRCQYDDGNRPWTQPLISVGVPKLADGDILHHKFGIIDGHTIITGSQNWSQAANTSNDETALIIQNPTVAAHFQQEFDQLYATAYLGIPASLQNRIQSQRIHCNL